MKSRPAANCQTVHYYAVTPRRSAKGRVVTFEYSFLSETTPVGTGNLVGPEGFEPPTKGL
jgi:hypothetical protein